MKILVLGGHGFVGKNVVETLKESQHEIIPLSKRDGLELTDYDITEGYLKDINPETIINCAAKVGSLNYVTQEAAAVFDVNMRMLLNIYKAAQETVPNAVIVNPVGNCAFPGNLDIYSEDSLWSGPLHQSVLSYGSTRRMMLILSECYSMQYGVRSINFFVPNMYGPHDSTDPNKAHALNALVSKLVKIKKENKKELDVWGRGIAIREWLFAGDFARVLSETVEKINSDRFDNPVNIGQKFGVSVRELLEIIIEELSCPVKLNWNRDMPDGAPCKIMDDSAFRKLMPDFEFTEMRTGIRETIRYYESIYPY